MSHRRPIKVADVVTLPNVLCNYLDAQRSGKSQRFNITPEFEKSDGISGILICKIKSIMGDGIYNIHQNDWCLDPLPFTVSGSTEIKEARSGYSEQLMNIDPIRNMLSGLLHVQFHNVTITQADKFDFAVYEIRYTSITVQRASDMYFFS